MGWKAPKGGRRRLETRLPTGLVELVERYRDANGLRSLNHAFEILLSSHPDLNTEGAGIRTGKMTAPSQDDGTFAGQDDGTFAPLEGSRTRRKGRARAKRNTYSGASDIDRRSEASGSRKKGKRSSSTPGPTDRHRASSVGLSVPVSEILSSFLTDFAEPWNAAEPDRCRALARRRGAEVRAVIIRPPGRPSTRLAGLIASAWSEVDDLGEWSRRFADLVASPYMVRDRLVRTLDDVLKSREPPAEPSVFYGLRTPGRYTPRPGTEYHGLLVPALEPVEVVAPVDADVLIAELLRLRRKVTKKTATAAELSRARSILATLPDGVAEVHKASIAWALKQDQGTP